MLLGKKGEGEGRKDHSQSLHNFERSGYLLISQCISAVWLHNMGIHSGVVVREYSGRQTVFLAVSERGTTIMVTNITQSTQFKQVPLTKPLFLFLISGLNKGSQILDGKN